MIKLNIVSCVFSLFMLVSFSGCAQNNTEYFVSPEGKNTNSGTKSEPLSFNGALNKTSELIKNEGLPKGGVKINVLGGTYRFNEVFVLGEEFKGTTDSPIIIEAVEEENVLFDGSLIIPAEGFEKVQDEAELLTLAKAATDSIMVTTITDKNMIARFNERLMLNLSIDGVEYLPSVFPNEGYAKFKEETEVSEVYPPGIPVGQEASGVRAGHVPHLEVGKPRGWKGSLEEPRGAQAGFSGKENQMGGTWLQWQNELEQNNTRNQLTGFIEANWLLSSQAIYAANAKTKSIHLSRALSYGWSWKTNDKPFRVFGLLCELDSPGEWHFNPLTNRLFIYPPKPITNETQISLAVANGFLELANTSYVQVIGLSVKNVGSGNVYKITGNNNLLASSKISNSTAVGVNISGTNNSVKGCDFVDLDNHIRLSGGKRSPTELTAGNNLVENCHIYQKNFKHEKVNIGMSGVGNIFRHNLVHNSLGQSMIVNGNDQLLEFNEFFNIGYEEGDGGAVYSGADLGGYGNVYKHNFFHHLMHVTGKIERSGLHLDDGQSGATCIGNIFYKSASKGIHIFGGSGHTLKENVFLEGDRGAYFMKSLGEKMYLIEEEIREGKADHRKGTKEDYIGRVLAFTGKNGWSKSPWKDKYPLMNTILSDTGVYGRMWPIKQTIEGNFYYGNKRSIAKIADRRIVPQVLIKSSIKNNVLITPNDFIDYNNLDLRLKKKDNLPNIPFEKIGLKLDNYRKEMPDKQHYRTTIKKFYKGINSGYPGTTLQINTANIVEE